MGMNLDTAIGENKVDCLRRVDGRITINTNHHYFYQIQGQLAISGAKICHFVVYTGDNNDLFHEQVDFDERLWTERMLPKLIEFYLKCLAPNIVEKRAGKGLLYRDLRGRPEPTRPNKKEEATTSGSRKRKRSSNNELDP
ncbi:uncharacterized protein LOC116162649 [Photinus pyralis]|uniref:uncharacterized protein LOC116162649 n=1 Tax=Photinus pyralis TaxID=7054 RepID=UPI0012676237|nr:uncharacterized protein LOC116162649 [Photinus pyralis]